MLKQRLRTAVRAESALNWYNTWLSYLTSFLLTIQNRLEKAQSYESGRNSYNFWIEWAVSSQVEILLKNRPKTAMRTTPNHAWKPLKIFSNFVRKTPKAGKGYRAVFERVFMFILHIIPTVLRKTGEKSQWIHTQWNIWSRVLTHPLLEPDHRNDIADSKRHIATSTRSVDNIKHYGVAGSVRTRHQIHRLQFLDIGIPVEVRSRIGWKKVYKVGGLCCGDYKTDVQHTCN